MAVIQDGRSCLPPAKRRQRPRPPPAHSFSLKTRLPRCGDRWPKLTRQGSGFSVTLAQRSTVTEARARRLLRMSYAPFKTFKSALLIAALLAMFMLPANASAGRLLATGHDTDSHCSLSRIRPPGQCHFVNIAIKYVRAVSPFAEQARCCCSTARARSSWPRAGLQSGRSVGSHVTMCPSSGTAFKREPLTTARYSAIVVGSSTDQLNIGSVATTGLPCGQLARVRHHGLLQPGWRNPRLLRGRQCRRRSHHPGRLLHVPPDRTRRQKR